MSSAGHHYVLRISLAHSKPEIWRRIRVAAGLPLTAVHAAIQIAMNWEALHLYGFSFGADRYHANPLEEDNLDVTELGTVAKKGDRFTYVYDFGDSWQHDVIVEDVVIPTRATQPVLCIDGEYASPPEDCGGMPGFERILAGEVEAPSGWEPSAFDIDDVNDELTELFGVEDYRTEDFVDENGVRLAFGYDPDDSLDEAAWDQLDTNDQLWSVAAYHHWMKDDADHPPIEILSAHALMHATIELHVASALPKEAPLAMQRLHAGGLTRHQAIHALATALEEAMLEGDDSDPDAYKTIYLERLRLLGTDAGKTRH